MWEGEEGEEEGGMRQCQSQCVNKRSSRRS